MSEDQTPEWVRVKREVESLWKGAWDAIYELWDYVRDLEKRLAKLELDFQKSDSKPARTRFHPRNNHPIDHDIDDD
jgi:hypothetical protein